jgi:hypothetical protein
LTPAVLSVVALGCLASFYLAASRSLAIQRTL